VESAPKWTNYLTVLLLLLMFAQLQGNASPTADEQEGIVRGYAWMAKGRTLAGKTPLLSHVLAALPLRLLPDLTLPGDEEGAHRSAWTTGNTQVIGDLFLWHLNPNADQILFLARLPNAALALLLAAFVQRWARELYGSFAGALALLLCAFDPNLLAHGRLATADLGVTVFALLSLFSLWRFLEQPTISHLYATGVSLGLAMACKFSALLLLPVLALLTILRAWRDQPFRLPLRLPLVASSPGETVKERLAWLATSGFWIALIAVLTVWVVYGFQVGTLPGTQFPILAPDYFAQLENAPRPFYPDEGEVHFLRGDLYAGRRWSYLLTAFLLKTPLPTLALVVVSVLIAFRGRTWRHDRPVLWPPVFFFCLGLASQVNSGYRYMLPIVPFFLIYASRVAAIVIEWIRGRGAFAGSLPTFGLFFTVLGWYIFGTIGVYPHYLAYFNEIAGGPENGWQNLIGEDLDRGQDLVGLKTWMDRHHVEWIKLAYQGVADPVYYDIAFDALPDPADTWENRHSFYPYEPAPGIYAISVNSLQGLHLAAPDTYAWFRQRKPMAKIGYSIFIYQVPRTSSSQAVACLSGLQPADIRPEDYRRLFETNDVRIKWFNVNWAFPFPAPGWTRCHYLIANDEPIPQLNDRVPWSALQKTFHQSRQDILYSATEAAFSASEIADQVLADNAATQVWWSPAISFLPGDPAAHAERLALPVHFEDRVELLGYTVEKQTIQPGETWPLITWWRVLRTDPEPLKIFAHLIDQQSKLHGGEDRLDVFTDGWEAGDVFVQIHRVPLSADAPPGTYQVELGWYDARTIQRLQVLADDSDEHAGIPVADRVLLTPIEVVE
jgi:hypothetical protein